MKTVFLVAGGTGGHVFPALALAEELTQRGIQVECMTDKRAEKYFLQTSITPHIIDSSAWASTWQGKLKAGYKIASGMVHSLELLREYGPSCVVGFGGYPSFPTMKAAQILKIPTILHEQNAVFGRANRQLTKNAKKIALSLENTTMLPLAAKNKTVVTGNPVRSIFLEGGEPFRAPKKNEAIHLLVFGGSQGSSIFSQVIPAAIEMLDPELRNRLVLVQQARLDDIDALMLAYNKISINARIQPFYNDMPKLYRNAHLVISRAGATTIAELTTLGRPAIIVPLAASLDGDQAQNARQLVASKAAWMLEEKDFTAVNLAARLTDILQNPAQLEEAASAAQALGKPAAASSLAELVTKYL